MDSNLTPFDKDVRYYVYNQAMRVGIIPTIAQVADALDAPATEVRSSFHRLASARMLVLQRDTDEVLMANPFSAVPTPFVAHVDGKSYYGNCIWDALGIPAMLGRDALIQSSCGDCGTAIPLQVVDGALAPASAIVHFAVPAAQWWNDIIFN